MRDFNEHNATEVVLARLDGCANPRFKEVMTSVITHLHAVVREVEPTEEEWMQAIRFLTRTGQMCDDKRQEWILLSDTLGVSMLVDAINTRKPKGCTESTVLGPFHVADSPRLPLGATISKDGKGEPTVVVGRVVDLKGAPVAGAQLDVWQTSHDGFYDVQQPGEQPEMNLRGRFTADVEGRYWFRTIKPTSYPIPADGPVGEMLAGLGRHPYRPSHIHFIVSAPGYESVVTQIFTEGDPYIDSDAVFGVKETLIRPYVRVTDPEEAERWGLSAPFHLVESDFVLKPAA